MAEHFEKEFALLEEDMNKSASPELLEHSKSCDSCAVALAELEEIRSVEKFMKAGFQEYDEELDRHLPAIYYRKQAGAEQPGLVAKLWSYLTTPAALTAAAAVVVIASVYVSGVFQPAPSTTLAFISHQRGEVWLNDKPAESAGLPMVAGDSIRTGKKGAVVIQLNNKSILFAHANTRLHVAQLDEKGETIQIELQQATGSLFVNARHETTSLAVKPRHTTAVITGTAFQVSTSAKEDEYQLLSGSLELSAKDQTHSLTASGKALWLKAKGKFNTEKLATAELQALRRLQRISAIDADVKKGRAAIKANDAAQLAAAVTDALALLDKKRPAGKTAAKLTLADIKKKYGKLTKIVTNTGKTYTGGNWHHKKGVHYLTTVSGVKKIKASEVAEILPVK